MRSTLLVTAGAVLMVTLGCALPTDDAATVPASAVARAFLAAFASKNATAVAAFYADDVEVWHPQDACHLFNKTEALTLYAGYEAITGAQNFELGMQMDVDGGATSAGEMWNYAQYGAKGPAAPLNAAPNDNGVRGTFGSPWTWSQRGFFAATVAPGGTQLRKILNFVPALPAPANKSIVEDTIRALYVTMCRGDVGASLSYFAEGYQSTAHTNFAPAPSACNRSCLAAQLEQGAKMFPYCEAHVERTVTACNVVAAQVLYFYRTAEGVQYIDRHIDVFWMAGHGNMSIVRGEIFMQSQAWSASTQQP